MRAKTNKPRELICYKSSFLEINCTLTATYNAPFNLYVLTGIKLVYFYNGKSNTYTAASTRNKQNDSTFLTNFSDNSLFEIVITSNKITAVSLVKNLPSNVREVKDKVAEAVITFGSGHIESNSGGLFLTIRAEKLKFFNKSISSGLLLNGCGKNRGRLATNEPIYLTNSNDDLSNGECSANNLGEIAAKIYKNATGNFDGESKIEELMSMDELVYMLRGECAVSGEYNKLRKNMFSMTKMLFSAVVGFNNTNLTCEPGHKIEISRPHDPDYEEIVKEYEEQDWLVTTMAPFLSSKTSTLKTLYDNYQMKTLVNWDKDEPGILRSFEKYKLFIWFFMVLTSVVCFLLVTHLISRLLYYLYIYSASL
jgi:hypothetical protein